MTLRFAILSLCAAGLVLGQTATTPSPAAGGVTRGRGPGGPFGPGRGGRGLDLFGRNSETHLTQALALDATQQNTLHTALQSAQVQRKGLNERAAGLQKELATAVRAGNEGAIESISRDLSALHEQQTTIHAKTLSTLYNSLNSTQRAKVEPMINHELGIAGPLRGPGFGRGGRGPAAPASTTATPQ